MDILKRQILIDVGEGKIVKAVIPQAAREQSAPAGGSVN
jgi:hypothetical protein